MVCLSEHVQRPVYLLCHPHIWSIQSSLQQCIAIKHSAHHLLTSLVPCHDQCVKHCILCGSISWTVASAAPCKSVKMACLVLQSCVHRMHAIADVLHSSCMF